MRVSIECSTTARRFRSPAPGTTARRGPCSVKEGTSSPTRSAVFDRICGPIEGFNYGRFDVRCRRGGLPIGRRSRDHRGERPQQRVHRHVRPGSVHRETVVVDRRALAHRRSGSAGVPAAGVGVEAGHLLAGLASSWWGGRRRDGLPDDRDGPRRRLLSRFGPVGIRGNERGTNTVRAPQRRPLHANTDHHRRRVGDPRSCRDRLGPGDQGAQAGSDQARPAAATPKKDAKTAANAKIAGMIGDTSRRHRRQEARDRQGPRRPKERRHLLPRPAGAVRAAASRPTW